MLFVYHEDLFVGVTTPDGLKETTFRPVRGREFNWKEVVVVDHFQ